jgi:hypothetical protein
MIWTGFSLGDDDSLSHKYNVMVVPVNMKGSKASNYSSALLNTFWIGAFYRGGTGREGQGWEGGGL